MLATSEDTIEVADSMKTQHPPPSYLPLLLNLEHDKPPAIGECTGGSLQGSDSSLPYLSPKVGETCGAGGYDGRHRSNPSISTFGKLEMQTSEACHKNFMIFDHSEDKNTVILHPSWLNIRPCQPSLEPQSALDARDFFSELQAFNNKAVEAMCSFRSSAAPNPEGALFPVYREAMESAVVQMQRKMVMNGFSSLSTKARCSLLEYVNAGEAPNLKKNASGISFPLDSGEELQSEFHEDTEEIDALLSSDDELSSTGHSPSDASSNCHNEHKKNHGNSIIGKKRKLQDCTVDEDDDADSGPGKPESGDTFSGASMKNLPCRANKGTTDFFDQVGERISHCKSGKSSGTFGEGGLVDRVKKIKIKTNVQRLKNVIPGGDGLDSAGVLSRTIQYVKSLQNRLRDLEATRELSGMKKTKLGLDGLLLNYCG